MEVKHYGGKTRMEVNLVTIISMVLGSSLVAVIVDNWVLDVRNRTAERKDLIAKAQASVLKRVELCYRIRRRTEDEEDVRSIRNLIHDVQEENDYYKSRLLVASRWYGLRYALYVDSIKELTAPSMLLAWQKTGDVAVEVEKDIKLNHKKIDKLSRQFSADSRRFLNFVTRLWMAVHDWFISEIDKYDV